MNKLITIFCIAALFFSSCSVFEKSNSVESTPVPPTPVPTGTPDPCAAENLLGEAEKVQDLVNAFQDAVWLSGFTPQTELVVPILRLQEVRRDLQKVDVPPCMEAVKIAALDYMNSTINYLAFFMAAKTQEDIDLAGAGMQTSDALWQIVLKEFQGVFDTAGLVSDELPDIGGSLSATSGTQIFVLNEGDQGVNVRSQPELGAEIIASLEPGVQALAISRNEAGDWLQINLEGAVGWVFAETVTSLSPLEELPISDNVQ